MRRAHLDVLRVPLRGLAGDAWHADAQRSWQAPPQQRHRTVVEGAADGACTHATQTANAPSSMRMRVAQRHGAPRAPWHTNSRVGILYQHHDRHHPSMAALHTLQLVHTLSCAVTRHHAHGTTTSAPAPAPPTAHPLRLSDVGVWDVEAPSNTLVTTGLVPYLLECVVGFAGRRCGGPTEQVRVSCPGLRF